MSEPLSLFDDSEDVFADISPYWNQRAAEFHAKNPEVYRILVHYARQAARAGRTRVGIELLWNRMRWDWTISTRHEDDYKLNQNYKAWYARLIMQREPDLSEMFEVRRRRGPV